MLEPIVPLAPARFSTTMVWPSASPTLPPTSRAMRSSGPGGNGTTMVIGFAVGQPWATAASVPASPNTARQQPTNNRKAASSQIGPVMAASDTKRACASRESLRGLRWLRREWNRWSKSACSSARSSCDIGVPPSRRSSAFACATACGPAISSSSIRRASACSFASAGQSCVDEADAHRLVGLEPLAGQEIAAQAGGRRSRAERSESADPARSRAAPPASRKMHRAPQSPRRSSTPARHRRRCRRRERARRSAWRADRARGRRAGMVARGFPGSVDAGAGAPISAPTQKCLPAPRSTTTRTAASAASRASSASNASSMA